MNYELIDQPRKVVQDCVAIVVNGEEIGTLERHHDGRGGRSWWHCKIEDGDCDFSAGLIQGFGKTEEEALRDAIASSAKEAELYLAAVKEIGFKLFGEGQEVE